MRRLTWGVLACLALLTGCKDDSSICAADQLGCPPPYQLSAAVDIQRDSQGVVHIRGQSDNDVAYAQGFAMARERLFEMDLIRRQALGRRAEVLGGDVLGDDIFIRRFNFAKLGQDNVDLMLAETPTDHALLVAWVAGVNAYIDQIVAGTEPLPYGFGPAELDYLPERWAPSDPMAIGKLFLFSNGNEIEFEILASVMQQYFPKLAEELPLFAPLYDSYILPEDERPQDGMQPLSGSLPAGAEPAKNPPASDANKAARTLPAAAATQFARFRQRMRPIRPGASNNWAIDGAFTENGRPLIAGDPHQPLRSPSLMWANHLDSTPGGGSLDVVGFSFVGMPAVHLGHNRSIAWTATTTHSDTMDTWEVTVSDGMVSLFGQDVPLSLRSESIAVRDSDVVIVDMEDVPGHGLLLPADLAPVPITAAGNRILFNWVGFEPTREGSAFLQLDRAETLEDFETAVDGMELGLFNFVAATQDGISLRSSPKTPDRGKPDANFAPFAVQDGNDVKTRWTGEFLGLDKMPHSRASGRGWLASSNNDPLGFTADSAVDGDEYYFGVFFDAGTRSQRAEDEIQRLISEGPVTMEQMKTLQLDTHMIVADLLLPELFAAHASVAADPDLAAYQNRADLDALVLALTNWDRQMRRDSSAAVVFNAFLFFAAHRALYDDMGLAFDTIIGENSLYVLKVALRAFTGGFSEADDYLQEGKSLVLMLALDDTASWLVDRFGSSDASAYSWGDYHGTSFPSPWGEALAGPFIPTDGGVGTINVSDKSFFNNGEPRDMLEVSSGAIFRLVTSFDEGGMPVSEFNYPRGNAGDPASPFFDNTLDDWVEGRYQPLLYLPEDIAADTQESWQLLP